jgi:hypothetical protein
MASSLLNFCFVILFFFCLTKTSSLDEMLKGYVTCIFRNLSHFLIFFRFRPCSNESYGVFNLQIHRNFHHPMASSKQFRGNPRTRYRKILQSLWERNHKRQGRYTHFEIFLDLSFFLF